MGYDLAVWYDPGGVTAGREREHYEALVGGRHAGEAPTARLRVLLDELASRWPGGTSEGLERGPWSSWPLPEGSSGGVLLSLRQGAPALEAVRQLAAERGFVVYDPQTNSVHALVVGIPIRQWLPERPTPFDRFARGLERPLYVVIGVVAVALLARACSG